MKSKIVDHLLAILESTIYSGQGYDAHKEIDEYSTMNCDTGECQPVLKGKAPIRELADGYLFTEVLTKRYTRQHIKCICWR